MVHLNIGLVCSCLFLIILRLSKGKTNQSVLSIYLAADVYIEIFYTSNLFFSFVKQLKKEKTACLVKHFIFLLHV